MTYTNWALFCAIPVSVTARAAVVITLRFSSCWVALRPAMLAAARNWPSVSSQLEISLGFRGPSPPQAFNPFGGGLLPGAWGAPNKGNANWAVGILGNAGRVWTTALRPDPPKKALCHTYSFGGADNKYRSLGHSKSGDCNNTAPLQLLGSTSAGRAGRGSDLAECLGSWRFPTATEGHPHPRLLTPSGGGLLSGAWGAPNKGNA